MPWYLTEYEADCTPLPTCDRGRRDFIGRFGGHVWAKDLRQARRIARRRNLGERVIGSGSRRRPYAYASEMLGKKPRTVRQKLAVVHAVCFLTLIAVRSRVLHVVDSLGDHGVLHETIHLLEFGKAANRELIPTRAALVARIREVEHATPGYRGA